MHWKKKKKRLQNLRHNSQAHVNSDGAPQSLLTSQPVAEQIIEPLLPHVVSNP